jgi:signal peptidase I
VIRLLVAVFCLVAVLGGVALANSKGVVGANDDASQRVVALETVVSHHGAEIGALRTEVAPIKVGQTGSNEGATPVASLGGDVTYHRMVGNSMTPTLHDGDLLLVDTAAYPSQGPARGDLILFDPPVVSETPYVKRAIGLPGETIEIGADGYVYVDGQRLDEPYTEAGSTECKARACEPVTVKEGEVYVLGDNRRNSADSRIFGPVDIDSVIGKVIRP